MLAALHVALDAREVVSLPEKTIKHCLAKNCSRCHGPEKQKGKLRLDEMSLEFSNDSIAAHWQDVLDTLNAGDMPPEDEKQPTKKELTGFLAELTGKLKDAKRQLSDQGREVAMRRLNRREYVNSIESLFGFRVGTGTRQKEKKEGLRERSGRRWSKQRGHFSLHPTDVHSRSSGPLGF